MSSLNDYAEYKKTKATVEELKEQNGYFINALYGNEDEERPEIRRCK